MSVENHNGDFRDKIESPQNSEMWSIIHFACMLNIIQFEHAGWHNDQGNCDSWKCAQDFHGSHPTETSLNAQFCELPQQRTDDCHVGQNTEVWFSGVVDSEWNL